MSLREINRIVSSSTEVATRGAEFVLLARCLARAKGDLLQAARFAEARGASNVSAILEKAAVSPGTISSPSFAGELSPYGAIAAAFASSLRHSGAFDAMLPAMLPVPLRARVIVVSSGATGATVGETSIKPVSKLSLNGNQLNALKSVAVVCVSDEVLRLSGPEGGALLAGELRSAVAAATDAQFVAILINGITPVTQTGTTPAAVATDIGTALATMTLGAGSRIFALTSGSFAAQLSVMMLAGGPAFPQMTPNGGAIGALSLVATDAVPGTHIVLADASQIAAASETITLDSSTEALIQLDTAPDSPPTGNTNLVSLWQQNMAGLRAERYFGAERLRTTAVAVIQ